MVSIAKNAAVPRAGASHAGTDRFSNANASYCDLEPQSGGDRGWHVTRAMQLAIDDNTKIYVRYTVGEIKQTNTRSPN